MPKKKKQKDEWNQSPKVSDDEDPSLLPKNMYNDPKRLQAAVASAIKSGLMLCLNELLGFPVSPIYKLEADGIWLNRIMAIMPFTATIASPCSATKFTYVKDLLAQHTQMLEDVPCMAFYNFMWFHTDGNPRSHLMDWINCIPEREPAFDQDPGTYICNHSVLCPIIFDEDLHMETAIEEIKIDKSNYTSDLHNAFHLYS
uniref:Uncharacterized protein n=1 Tax=Romanomermis culicivorax TaxID=13658 RepID=A0A915K0R6_ROMCU